MIEKRAEIGLPIRCGEGISSAVLDLLDLPETGIHISTRMDGARIISPSGHKIEFRSDPKKHDTGYILNRDMFDRMLAIRAFRSGADINVMCEAVGMEREDGQAVIRCKSLKDTFDIRAKIVIAADGFESKIARWGGLDPSLSPRDIDSCIQYRMTGVEHDGSFCDFFIGKRYAPGGYVWCFPKGNDLFNVGLGINESMINGPSFPKRCLDRFVGSDPDFTQGKIVEVHAGGVSVGLPMDMTVADNLMVVGDAARIIDPLTGGGIYNACVSSIHAGRIASECIEAGSYSSDDLEPYDKAWREDLLEQIVFDYLAKERFLDADDELLDSVISKISSYDLNEISTEVLINVIKNEFPDIFVA